MGTNLHISRHKDQDTVSLFAHGNKIYYSMWSHVINLLTDNFSFVAWDIRTTEKQSEDERAPLHLIEGGQRHTRPSSTRPGYSHEGLLILPDSLHRSPRGSLGTRCVFLDSYSSTQCRLRTTSNLCFRIDSGATQISRTGALEATAGFRLVQIAVGHNDIEQISKEQMGNQPAPPLARAVQSTHRS